MRLSNDWVSPIYAFFDPTLIITYNSKGHCAHAFQCSATACKGKSRGVDRRLVNCFLDTKDRKSTSNLKCHAIACWGAETIHKALKTKMNIGSARKILGNMKNGSLVAAFERKGGGKVSYSHRQHTKVETRYRHDQFCVSIRVERHLTG